MSTIPGFLIYKSLLSAIASRYGYDSALLAAQAHQESRFNPRAVSPAGAMGIMQFMPATWGDWGQGKDPMDPEASLDAGIRYMKMLAAHYKDAAEPKSMALAAYNWGMGNVDRVIRQAGRTDYAGIARYLPQETRDYVPAILGRMDMYRALLGVSAGTLSVGMIILILLVAASLRTITA